jgi:hypothetical protein
VLTELLPLPCFAVFSARDLLTGNWSCGAQSKGVVRKLLNQGAVQPSRRRMIQQVLERIIDQMVVGQFGIN